jgi:succinyl-CoA synthetase beta subunit
VATPDRRACAPAEAAAEAAAIGFPVALKLLDAEILHKAQVGGVRLNLRTPDEVTAAVTRMTGDLAGHGLTADRLLVERMVEAPEREMIVGVTRSPSMGMAMILGDGGAAAEDRARFSTVLLPLAGDALERAMAAQGVAGHAALRAALLAVAALVDDLGDGLHGVEVNPLILTTAGDAIAADAVVQLRRQTETPAKDLP